ncbi:MAG: carboxylesterase/lipase family protein [Ilumatobacteraceae bacterium]
MVEISNHSGSFFGSKFNEKVDEFLGIRFAHAERFQAPIDIEKYSEVVKAKSFGPQSPQVPGFMEEILNTKQLPTSEDCLYLNIWKPSVVKAPLPVLFWIHGGAYTNGTAATSWYHGANLVQLGEVIVVSVNYRLGPFGFIGENNLGLLDQISALRWVKRNIESFGGDPDNVTIFGESAGGSSVVALTASPLTKGLITKAWAMSPSLLQLRSRAEADEAMSAFFEVARVDSLNGLKTLTTQQIVDATAQMFLNVENYISTFSPTRGGSGLPEDVYDASAKSDLPLIVGTNRDENRLWAVLNPQPLDEADATKYFEKAFADSATSAWTTYGQFAQNPSPAQMVAAMQTDQHFRVPAWQLCDTRSKIGAETWMYWFTWPTPIFDGVLGCCHALDLPFMFSNLDKPNVELFTGTSPVRSKISGHFTGELLQFAKTGKVSWPTYETSARKTLRIDEDVEVLTDPDPVIRKLWNLSS